MENSPLGKLSAELRNTISEMVLEHYSIKCILSPHDDGVTCRQVGIIYEDDGKRNKHPCALAHTCKQARAECTKLYYARNEFLIDTTTISHEQFCTWFQGFTKTAGPTLGTCDTTESLDALDDEAMVSSLRKMALRLPKHLDDGLAQLSFIGRTCTFLGEPEVMIFDGTAAVAYLGFTASKLDVKRANYAVHRQGVAGVPQHSSKCFVRACRMTLCLMKAYQKLTEEEQSNVLQPNYPHLSMLASACDSLERSITRELMVPDTPCSGHRCRPMHQR